MTLPVPPRPALPMDAVLPDVVAALRSGSSLVIQAEPGAGKTTRVPPALLHAGLAARGEIIVAQPRRIAARMAAGRVAAELGERVGERCGYQVRFDSAVSEATKIRFVTEGLLARRLRDDPELRGTAVVILDEIHERHVDTDLCLALSRRLQRSTRPDLKIVAMSATLEADRVAAYLDAQTVQCTGRAFPVQAHYAASDRPLHTQVAAAVAQVAAQGLDGSVLVFLPGAREIRRAAQACEPVARAHGLEIATLHGDLPAKDQDRAVAPGLRPKLILSTNVAETSVTIDGVVVVIDSGVARRPSHDPWSGVPTLTLAKISRASATQRMGRAGRTRPGHCVRLYSEHDLARRPAHDTPELHRLDLAGAMLDLRAAGLRGSGELQWLDAPPAASVHAADTLLTALGALDVEGALTRVGKTMLRYPTHPRLARLLVEARARKVGGLGAGVAALLAERSIRPRAHSAATSQRDATADVLADLADLDAARGNSSIAARLDRVACQAVQRVRKQLLRVVGDSGGSGQQAQDELCAALLVAFPDRVARAERRAGRPDRLVFAAGGDAELSPQSVVHGADLVVALAVERRTERGAAKTIVRSAAHIEAEWLLEVQGDRLTEAVQVRFDAAHSRVEATAETRYDGLLIDSTPQATLPPHAATVLRDAAMAAGVRRFMSRPEEYDALLRRASLLGEHRAEFPALDEGTAQATLAAMCEGRRSFAQLRQADLLGQLLGGLPPLLRAALARLVPTHATLPGGRRLQIHYEPDRAPWVQSRLQDFFGSSAGPAVLEGAVPLVLHLLAPNRRAVQVTTDLAGFWVRHYPDLRKALMRRYPRHDWPQDPQQATPPAASGGRSRGRPRGRS